jgi:mono/diheme cytochrome c family protein
LSAIKPRSGVHRHARRIEEGPIRLASGGNVVIGSGIDRWSAGGAWLAAQRWLPQLLLAGLLAGPAPAARAQAASRGALLYQTHCVACHSEKLHWRDARLATDWPSLKAQVRDWQAVAQLRWTEDDIVAVTQHLNDAVYHFDRTAGKQGSALPTTPGLWAGSGHGNRAWPHVGPARVESTAAARQGSVSM